MRTNIDIDEDLIREAQALLGLPTKKATVEAALKLAVRSKRLQGLRALRGKVELWPDYDYRAMR